MTLPKGVIFLLGFICGGLVLFLGALYLAQRASPVWTREEELGLLYELESQTRAHFKEGNLAEALENITAASVIRESRSRLRPYGEWSYTFPTIALNLAALGSSPQQFIESRNPDPVVLQYQCVEIFLLARQRSTEALNRRIDRLRKHYPKADEKFCRQIAQGFLF